MRPLRLPFLERREEPPRGGVELGPPVPPIVRAPVSRLCARVIGDAGWRLSPGGRTGASVVRDEDVPHLLAKADGDDPIVGAMDEHSGDLSLTGGIRRRGGLVARDAARDRRDPREGITTIAAETVGHEPTQAPPRGKDTTAIHAQAILKVSQQRVDEREALPHRVQDENSIAPGELR